jgi:hypothetical protein
VDVVAPEAFVLAEVDGGIVSNIGTASAMASPATATTTMLTWSNYSPRKLS